MLTALLQFLHQHFHYFPVQILQANVELQFRPSKEHAFALQAPIAKGWRRLYQNVSKVAGIFRSDGEPGWTWSWHLRHPLLIQVDRSNHATHCKLKKLGVAFKFLLSARETSETAKILSGEFVESGSFWTYLCCLVMFQCRKADVSRWNQVLVLSSISEGEVIHVTWGKPGQSPKVDLEWLGKFGR